MTEHQWVLQRDALEQSFVRGLSRQTLDLPEPFSQSDKHNNKEAVTKQHLDLLAALATRRRFDSPVVPPEFETDVPRNKSLNPVQGVTRIALNRYFKASHDSSGNSVTRVFSALKKRHLHAHPFDYRKLEHLVDAIDNSLLDDEFRSWLNQKNGHGQFTGEEIHPGNWLDFPMPRRLTFIAQLHREQAKTARDLLTEHIGGETAANRARLLNALQPSISQDDQSFLSGLLQDRSKVVRELLNEMLAIIPGTEQHMARVEEAVSRLSLRKKRLRRKSVIVVDAPGNLNQFAAQNWYAKTFSGINPQALATALQLDRDQFISALEEPLLATHCFIYYAKVSDLPAVKQMVSQLGEKMLDWFSGQHSVDFDFSEEIKSICWSELIKDATADSFWHWCHQVQHVVTLFCSPMTPDACSQLLSSKAFKAGLAELESGDDPDNPNLLEEIVALFPVRYFEELTARLADVPPRYNYRAKQLMNLLTLIETEPMPVPTL